MKRLNIKGNLNIKSIISIFLLLVLPRIGFASYSFEDGHGCVFSWSMDDIVGIYTTNNTRIVHWCSEVNGNNVIFTSLGWALSANTLYYAYYPYNSSYQINKYIYTELPIKYTEQTQESNDNTAHLSKYDYMTTQATTGASDVTFNFNHLGSIIRFVIDIQETETISELTLSTNGDKKIITEATMDVTNNTITATSTATAATLKLNDITIEGGSSLIAYMMIAPNDYVGSTFTLTLSSKSGAQAQAIINGTTILPGKTYPVQIKRLTSFMKQDSKQSQLTAKAKVAPLQDFPPTDISVNDATSITYPKGYAPDFLIDNENQMTEYILLGDADDDGQITMNDANIVVNYYLGNKVPYIDFQKADVDGDGTLTMSDANGIVNIYLGQ